MTSTGVHELKLRLTDTQSGRKDPLVPLQPGLVRMYHCGPTVVEPVNLDKFRSYLLGDVLRRVLESHGVEVKQVMNITDVGQLNEFDEDSIEIAAGRSGLYAWELADKEEAAFHQDRRTLNILDAHHYPRAREHVPEMISFIQELLAAGAGYRSGNHLYFDSSRVRSFGRLSHLKREELVDRQRQSIAPIGAAATAAGRRHPLDFDLWRFDPNHQMSWPSPWGRGFPGWHVECAVMSRKYLGIPFDVHSGTEENMHPHHECEMAQVEAAGSQISSLWIHSAHVLLEGKPIARGNRNLLTVRGLLESSVGGREIRLALLSAPYRERIEFQPDLIDEAQQAIRELKAFRDGHRSPKATTKPSERAIARLEEARAAFDRALEDDLNVPAALRAARDLARDLDPARTAPLLPAADLIERFDRVLGVL